MNWYSIVAIIISTFALIIAAKNYRRKAGLLVRGASALARAGIAITDTSLMF